MMSRLAARWREFVIVGAMLLIGMVGVVFTWPADIPWVPLYAVVATPVMIIALERFAPLPDSGDSHHGAAVER